MKTQLISNKSDKDKILNSIGVTKEGAKFLKDKMELRYVYIKDLKTPAALILKQDALSIGADLAVSKNTILNRDKTTDALLIATDKELKILSKKEKAQPFGLKEIANELKTYTDMKEYKDVKVMGVINANDDSFYEGSRYKGDGAIRKIEEFIEDGASIIDIGAVSSQPGSQKVDEQEEFERLKGIVDSIYTNKLYEKAVFSLDSYSPISLKYAFDRGFKIANDITGLQNDEVAKVVSEYHATVVIMHMKGTPKDMQKDPNYENVILEIDEFFQNRIDKAKSFGIKDIVLDVGVGFGKKLQHNLALIKHLEHFKHFGYPILVGASRKSLIDMITPTPVQKRLPGTLALHLEAVKNGASIVRCHDVKEHTQAFKVQKALNEVVL